MLHDLNFFSSAQDRDSKGASVVVADGTTLSYDGKSLKPGDRVTISNVGHGLDEREWIVAAADSHGWWTSDRSGKGTRVLWYLAGRRDACLSTDIGSNDHVSDVPRDILEQIDSSLKAVKTKAEKLASVVRRAHRTVLYGIG